MNFNSLQSSVIISVPTFYKRKMITDINGGVANVLKRVEQGHQMCSRIGPCKSGVNVIRKDCLMYRTPALESTVES